MNRRILALLLALVMVAGLMTGCASGKQEAAAPETAQPESPAAEETAAEPEQTEESPAEEEAPAEPETVSFTDSLGRTVELPADITRIAPSGAVATMILAAIAPECMVTINAAPSENQMAFLPANLAALPETGQMYGSKANLNLETLLAADPQAAIDQLRKIGAISDYRGITVIFYGLGQSTGNQAIPASAKRSLENIYAGIVNAGGGQAVIATDALEALGCDEELPDTGIVDLRADSLDIPALAKGESTQIVLDSAVLTFKGDSAEYADEAQSANVLGEIARVAMSGGYKVAVEGYTADSPSRSDDFLKALSQNRANAVADSLSSLGVPAGNITATGCGSEGSSSMASGSFNESQAQVDRRVVITLANAG